MTHALLLGMLLAGTLSSGEAISLVRLQAAPPQILTSGGESAEPLKLERNWTGNFCTSKITNTDGTPIRIKEIVLFQIDTNLPLDTPLYGEGFTMLAQTAGTLGAPQDITGLPDRSHYRIPQPEDSSAFYGMMSLAPPDRAIVLAFTSCRRFVGKFYLREGSIKVVLDTENLALAPGQSWDLEEFAYLEEPHRPDALLTLATRIEMNHPRLPGPPLPPAGWCSWYCFGPMVTATQVAKNADFIAGQLPQLEYVQIDDGYQAAMGDWLDTGRAFGGDIQGVLRGIRERGLKPAIWVAPFIAQEKSRLFQEHPHWFIQDEAGAPLRSDKVTFGGWREGPWYALDGTHPQAQQHLEHVFRTMREEWGCQYFKLDANFWGAMHGGRFHDPNATRVEAYRRGMEALLRGSGDAFILGCNHPIWPSLGLIHGSRSSNDISRSWEAFSQTSRENLSRNWQNGHLWWNDPDCILLTGHQPENEFMFHAAAILASGGMLLSGDNLPSLSGERLDVLKKLLLNPHRKIAADFPDQAAHDTGIIRISEDEEIVCLFNPADAPAFRSWPLPGSRQVMDFWSGRLLVENADKVEAALAPHSARVFHCRAPR